MRHHVRDETRGYRAYARAGAHTEPVDSPEGQVIGRVDAQNRARALAHVLAALKPQDRDLLLLSSWAGLSHAEIAEATGLGAPAVRLRLHRARARIKAQAPAVALDDEG